MSLRDLKRELLALKKAYKKGENLNLLKKRGNSLAAKIAEFVQNGGANPTQKSRHIVGEQRREKQDTYVRHMLRLDENDERWNRQVELYFALKELLETIADVAKVKVDEPLADVDEPSSRVCKSLAEFYWKLVKALNGIDLLGFSAHCYIVLDQLNRGMPPIQVPEVRNVLNLVRDVLNDFGIDNNKVFGVETATPKKPKRFLWNLRLRPEKYVPFMIAFSAVAILFDPKNIVDNIDDNVNNAIYMLLNSLVPEIDNTFEEIKNTLIQQERLGWPHDRVRWDNLRRAANFAQQQRIYNAWLAEQQRIYNAWLAELEQMGGDRQNRLISIEDQESLYTREADGCMGQFLFQLTSMNKNFAATPIKKGIFKLQKVDCEGDEAEDCVKCGPPVRRVGPKRQKHKGKKQTNNGAPSAPSVEEKVSVEKPGDQEVVVEGRGPNGNVYNAFIIEEGNINNKGEGEGEGEGESEGEGEGESERVVNEEEDFM